MKIHPMSLLTFWRFALPTITRLNIAGKFVSNSCALGVYGLVVMGAVGGLHTQANAQVSVSDGGTASYSVGIAVPPGIGGMVPKLGLTLGGRTWAIQGTSVITRCPANKLVDGVGRAVDNSGNDKLCLDGHRLIQTDANGVVVNAAGATPPFQQNDSLGGTGFLREYRTENDTFARIRAYGMVGGNAANGPAYFRVWTKGGQIFEYGVNSNSTANAQITATMVAQGGRKAVVAWPVSRVSDTVGNYMDFQYDQRDVAWGSANDATGPVLGHEWYLKEIRYTGNGTQVPVNKVVFEYVDRVDTPGAAQDRSEAYHVGTKRVSVKLLSKIKTFVNWPAGQATQPSTAIQVKSVSLAYELGPVTGRSRAKSIVECAGSSTTKCLPATTFAYAPGASAAFSQNTAFKSSAMSSLVLKSGAGTRGILTGNFLGKGKTDILRWSDVAAENELYRSEGDGTFVKIAAGTAAGQFNITDQNLFKSNGCYFSVAADFNGDGLTDILRFMKPFTPTGISCGTQRQILYRAKGDGSFTSTDVGIDFTEKTAKITAYEECDEAQFASTTSTSGQISTSNTLQKTSKPVRIDRGAALATAPSSARKIASSPPPTTMRMCSGTSSPDGTTSQVSGRNYHLIDVNDDGLVDVVTTDLPGYARTATPPTDAQQCAGKTCTRVYLQQSGGTFAETTTNLASRSVYADPPTFRNVYWRRPYVIDANGDQVSDLAVDSGVWVSQGNGNFTLDPAPLVWSGCQNTLDFNGDGRPDCLSVYFEGAASQSMLIADGTGMKYLSNFNLKSAGQELLQFLPTGGGPGTIESAGFEIADINGDGRSDILRWKDAPGQNAVYLSNGDGTFRQAADFNLTTFNDQLKKSDGSYSFVTGDFSGRGNAEILRIKTDATGGTDATSNVLYTKTNATPQDQLVSVVSGTGLVTALTWVPLSNSSSGLLGARYANDQLQPNAAVHPVVDLMPPMYVVATVTGDSGVGQTKKVTEYSYAGYKGAHDGRGILGFRETRRQDTAPNGDSVTTVTQHLQTKSYAGRPSVTETRLGSLSASNPQVLGRATYIYCDKTAAVGAAGTATKDQPCPTNGKVRRPYLYQSSTEAWDLTGVKLPINTTVNTLNDRGDPTQVVSTTTGQPVGIAAQVTTRTTTNAYYPDNTAGDTWILGQVQLATVRSSVTDSLGNISTSAGSAPNATATKGTGVTTASPPLPTPVAAWLMPVLSLILD
jgi:hypothetical protein